MKAIGYITTALVTIVIGNIWRGYALSKLRGWFIVTTFAMKPIGIAAAMGLSCVVGFLTNHYKSTPKDTRSVSEKMIEEIVVAVLWPAFALGFGAVVKMWM